jgi:probable HAF family extracellular repeat protein
LTFLHVVGADETEVNGISAFDQITGTFVASEYHGFLSNLTSGAFDVLPEAPNGGFTTPTGLNTAGQVVGTYVDNHTSVVHGFIYDNGTFSNIDFPGAQETKPMGINDFSQVVGNYFDGKTEHGFLDDGGSFVYFDIPGAIATRNTGINDYGQIVGFYNDVSGHSHGFLLTPIPGSTPAPSRRVGVNDTVRLLRSIANSGPAERPDLRSLLRAVSSTTSDLPHGSSTDEQRAAITRSDPLPTKAAPFEVGSTSPIPLTLHPLGPGGQTG